MLFIVKLLDQDTRALCDLYEVTERVIVSHNVIIS